MLDMLFSLNYTGHSQDAQTTWNFHKDSTSNIANFKKLFKRLAMLLDKNMVCLLPNKLILPINSVSNFAMNIISKLSRIINFIMLKKSNPLKGNHQTIKLLLIGGLHTPLSNALDVIPPTISNILRDGSTRRALVIN